MHPVTLGNLRTWQAGNLRSDGGFFEIFLPLINEGGARGRMLASHQPARRLPAVKEDGRL